MKYRSKPFAGAGLSALGGAVSTVVMAQRVPEPKPPAMDARRA
jgi:hypothetical protein